MIDSLDEEIALAARYLDPAILSTEGLGHIAAIAQRFPKVSAFGFECRLGEAAPRADFGVRFLRDDKRSPAGFEEALAPAARRFAESDVWRRLAAFCDRWSDPRDVLYQGIEDIFLEFDIAGPPHAIPIPSFFLELDKGASRALTDEATLAALSVLGGGAPSPSLRDGWRRALDALPRGAKVTAVGSMLSRATRSVRVCVTGLPAPAVSGYVAAAGWPGDPGALDALIASVAGSVDRVEPCFDLGDAFGEKIGVELQIDGPRREKKARWTPVLDQLVAAGHGLPEKRDALGRWMGYARTPGEGAVCLISREINHVKLVHQREQPLEAKVYLAFMRTWQRPAPPGDAALDASPPR
jgi:hypothetical protein